MIRKKEEIISKVLTEFLRNEGLETPLMEYRIVQAWPQVVGESISRYTGNLFVKNGILNVKIKSAPLRQNLSMTQTLLTRKLNEAVGYQVISGIKFF